MADDRIYNVICNDGCMFEGMTKEQILTAIEQAVSSGTITDVDTGFVTKIKEQNEQSPLKFWVGTQAEYNALNPKPTETLFLISDDDELETLESLVVACQNAIDDIDDNLAPLLKNEYVAIDTSPVVSSDVVYINARRIGNAVILTGRIIVQPTTVTIKIADTNNAPKFAVFAPVTAVSVGGAYKAGYCAINTSGAITLSGVTANDTVYLNMSYGIPQ